MDYNILKVQEAMAKLDFKIDYNPKAVNALGKSIPISLVQCIVEAVTKDQVKEKV